MPAVHKFGGSALSNGQTILRAAEIIASRGSAPTVVVVSALAGVTDSLLQLAHSAASGREDLQVGVSAIRQRHVEAATECGDLVRSTTVHAELSTVFDGLLCTLQSVRSLGRLWPSDEASVLSVGEKLAAHLLAASINAGGNKAVVVDASKVMAGCGGFTDATPDEKCIFARSQEVIQPLISAGFIPVVPGFYGVNDRGDVVTFGRGGSDLTAACLGRALGASEVVLWKDVPGLMTADPRVVRNARPLRKVSLLEAAELSRLGAKVLHPGAIDALGGSVRLRIRAFMDDSVGTTISSIGAGAGPAVKAITAADRGADAVIGVVGEGLASDASLAAHALMTLSTLRIEVLGISTGSLGQSFSLTVHRERSAQAQCGLHDAFQLGRNKNRVRSTRNTPGACGVLR